MMHVTNAIGPVQVLRRSMPIALVLSSLFGSGVLAPAER